MGTGATDQAASQEARTAPPHREFETLPSGVDVFELRSFPDDRGAFTELFRSEWGLGIEPVQWNAVRSEAGVLRGVHTHLVHDDYLTVVAGRAVIGLCDLRADSPTHGLATTVELSAQNAASIRIPHGVAHGFAFLEPSMHVYSVSHVWNLDDELGCRWDDPQLGIAWPDSVADPALSPRDAGAPSLAEMISDAGSSSGLAVPDRPG